MGKIVIQLLLVLLVANGIKAQDSTCRQRYVKTGSGYLMVLREGDNVFQEIEKLATVEKVPAASFYGLGFAGSATFGFYDFDQKKFNPKESKRVEMGSLTGSIAWNEKGPSLHMHGVATDENFQAFGGHLLSLKVGTGSMEITVLVHPQKLERKVEQPLNANVLQLPPCAELLQTDK